MLRKLKISHIVILLMTAGLASLIITTVADNYYITPTEPTIHYHIEGGA